MSLEDALAENTAAIKALTEQLGDNAKLIREAMQTANKAGSKPAAKAASASDADDEDGAEKPKTRGRGRPRKADSDETAQKPATRAKKPDLEPESGDIKKYKGLKRADFVKKMAAFVDAAEDRPDRKARVSAGKAFLNTLGVTTSEDLSEDALAHFARFIDIYEEDANADPIEIAKEAIEELGDEGVLEPAEDDEQGGLS